MLELSLPHHISIFSTSFYYLKKIPKLHQFNSFFKINFWEFQAYGLLILYRRRLILRLLLPCPRPPLVIPVPIRRIRTRRSGSLALLPSLKRAGLSRSTISLSKLFNCQFDHDLKKIEAFVGSKTVIQIHSHAQNYFLKVQ